MMWAERGTYLIRQAARRLATFPKGEGFTDAVIFSFYPSIKFLKGLGDFLQKVPHIRLSPSSHSSAVSV